MYTKLLAGDISSTSYIMNENMSTVKYSFKYM